MAVNGKSVARCATRFGALLFGFCNSQVAQADWKINLTHRLTGAPHETYGFRITLLWIGVAISAGVFGMIIYSIIDYRKSCGAEVNHFHKSAAVELMWTIIPFFILLLMVLPSALSLKIDLGQ